MEPIAYVATPKRAHSRAVALSLAACAADHNGLGWMSADIGCAANVFLTAWFLASGHGIPKPHELSRFRIELGDM